MKKKSPAEILKIEITFLKNKQAMELELLKDQFHVVRESLRPINLIQHTLDEVATSPGIKNNLVNNLIGFATGYLSKKILVGASHNPLKKLVGVVLEFAVANVVAKHPGAIKSTGGNLLQRLIKYRKERKAISNNGTRNAE